MYTINHELREKVEKLERQNLELRREAEKVPQLEEQVRAMRQEVSAYQTLQLFRDSSGGELKRELYKMAARIEELEERVKEQDGEQGSKQFRMTSTTLQRQEEEEEEAKSSSDDERYLYEIEET